MSPRGRPLKYEDDTIVGIQTSKKSTRLNNDSERRAIVNAILDSSGRITLEDLDKQFGYSIRPRVLALIKAGWIYVINEGAKK